MLKSGFKNLRFKGISGFTFSLKPLALSLRSLALSLFFIFCLLNAATASAATIALSWDPPASNNDGTLYTNLSGYKIYYGTSSGNYSQSIDVGNVVTYTLNNLTDNVTYYFATTAYNTSNIETPYSNEIHCLNTTSSCVGGGGGSGGGGDGGGGGGETQTALNSSGDASISGGGCGFVKNDNGKGPKANGEWLSMIMLFLLLILLKLKKTKIPVCQQAGM